MAVDIGTQIIIVFIFGVMALFTKKDYPNISKFFGWSTAILFVLFSALDIIDAVVLVKP
jgi:membrane protein implicated in regulation of membrane protease activity